jgi:hypothetical protein
MAKKVRKDVNQIAKNIVDIATGETPKPKKTLKKAKGS